uniref:XPA binding protein 2 n=1 Tax=Pelodiscus sinensis TaxID=13735 RepID=K7FDD3_PELSI
MAPGRKWAVQVAFHRKCGLLRFSSRAGRWLYDAKRARRLRHRRASGPVVVGVRGAASGVGAMPELEEAPVAGGAGKPDLFFEEEDLQYEEEILRNPFSVKCWIRYIEFKQNAPRQVLNLIYERALKELPGSYKLWYNYLKQRRKQVKNRCVTDPGYEEVNNCHERALVFMHKMPRIWLDYCQFLMDQCRITRTRRTFDRALRALPITQHHRIWPLYLKFVRLYPLPETAVRVYRRYLKLSPENAEEYIEYLRSIDRLDEAALRLAVIVNDERFVSKEGKSNYQLWHELCDLISQNPDKVKSLNVGAIIRGGLTRFTDQLGKLWCSLADYYIRSGHFEKARDVYEEAIQTVMTVRDFTQVFDSYAQFEESMIAAKMETTSELGQEEEDDVDLELRLARFEQLIARRPLLLNSVLLRQNPHNVHEWHKRVKLYEGKPREIINTYTEAVQTVDPFKATGKTHTLWVSFARFYEDNGQIEDARTIFEKATKVNFKQVDDLAGVWCEYGEMELRHENYDQALRILRVSPGAATWVQGRHQAAPPSAAGESWGGRRDKHLEVKAQTRGFHSQLGEEQRGLVVRIGREQEPGLGGSTPALGGQGPRGLSGGCALLLIE